LAKSLRRTRQPSGNLYAQHGRGNEETGKGSHEKPSREKAPAIIRDSLRRHRAPCLKTSRERLELFNALAKELAIIKQETKGGSTVEGLKQKFPKFIL
jgi:hypothetical protein